jgi:molybdate/tungstate transport system ATP-binding protein
MIEVNVEKQYGKFFLKSSFLASGIICITGRNGSGKTTLLNIIAGIIKPDAGYIKINGKDITNLPIEKRKVAIITPDTYLPHMKVNRHITWGLKFKNDKTNDELKRIKEVLSIDFNKKLNSLSSGMRIRVAIATALFSYPEVILIDEALSYISDRSQFMKNLFNEVLKMRIDLIFTTQYSEDCNLAQNCYQMESGILKRIDCKNFKQLSNHEPDIF